MCRIIALWAIAVSARSETVCQADRIRDFLVLNEVYLNEKGPYRMMIDTGNSSSILRPEVAATLGLHSAYDVEVENAAGVRRAGAAVVDALQIGSVRDENVPVVITNVRVPGVDGIVGQSWLHRHDYTLDYRNNRLVLDPAAPPEGIRTALLSSDGRPQVSVEIDGHRQDLVVDSGASTLVLFGQQLFIPVSFSNLATNGGTVEGSSGSARVTIGKDFSRRLNIVVANVPPRPGLLPAVLFRQVYVSNRDGVVVLKP
jgi:predicted aspartyl protease